jgi:YfiH family protein
MFMIQPQPNRGFEWTQAPWGPALRCVPLEPFAQHLFTTGNLQLRDDAAEWDAVAGALGVSRSDVLLIRQVHGAAAAVVRRPFDKLRAGPFDKLRAGPFDKLRAGPFEWTMPEADIIVSDDPAAAIGVRVADCAPILMADTRAGAVGAAHAGWRGTVQSAAAAAVRSMQREFGTDPADLVAAIGPCLGACCGEVGPEVVEAFRQAGHDDVNVGRWFSDGPRGRPMLDLWQANVDQLAAAGVSRANIHVAGICTKTHAAIMHSYRAAGAAAGRMLGVIRCSQ